MTEAIIDTPAEKAVVRAPEHTTREYSTLYADLQSEASVPDASVEVIDASHAIFQAMYLDLAGIKQKLLAAPAMPPVVTVYADVLNVAADPDPDGKDSNLVGGLKWSLSSAALVVFARRLVAGSNVQINLDFRHSQSARFILFADELVGSLNVVALAPGQAAPVVFPITALPRSGGLVVDWANGAPQMVELPRAAGFSLADRETDWFTVALDNSFIFGSLLFDREPPLALKILTWVKSWAAESPGLLRLFLRSSSMAALLTAQLKARALGATFVPYLAPAVYTELARAYAAEVQDYETKYLALTTQKVLTEQNIQAAKALYDNALYQSQYVQALKEQAQKNSESAAAAVSAAKEKLRTQQFEVKGAGEKFTTIGLERYKEEKIEEGIVNLLTAVVTFGAAIGAMALGQEEAAPAAASSATGAVKGVADAAATAPKVASLAENIEKQMENLKNLIEALEKLYEFSKELATVATDLEGAESKVSEVREMDLDASGLDLAAGDEWKRYQIETDAALQMPIDEKIEYASEYKQALDIMVVYGQSLTAAQVAAIQAEQELARVLLQEQLAKQQQARLKLAIDSLQAGQTVTVALMQQLYHRYLDSKSSLVAALENYRASYFYWALTPSSVRGSIVDKAGTLGSVLTNLTAIVLDNKKAFDAWHTPPTRMDQQCVVDSPDVLAALARDHSTSWVLGPDDPVFARNDRVRVNRMRVWLEGAATPDNTAVSIAMSTSGNYHDRFNGVAYRFTSEPLTRGFEYGVNVHGRQDPAYQFDNGQLGYVEVDSSVAEGLSYVYFEPTPFTEWTITVKNRELDLSKVTRIVVQFEGSAIFATEAA